jgi:hypothetical protein
MELPVTQNTSCVLETRLDIHEQVSYYYILYRDTSTQDTSCALETRIDIYNM